MKILRRKLWIESFLATLLVFLTFLLLFFMIHISFKPFNYIANTIKEININDLYFASLTNNTVDTNIVIVNVEDIDRKGIADVLQRVYTAQPALIGVDIFFSTAKCTPYDSLLKATINGLKDKVVMAEYVGTHGEESQEYWTFDGVVSGHAGILSNEKNTKVVREFQPRLTGANKESWAFSAMLVKMFKPEAFSKLEKRNNETELINYTGDLNSYRVINYSDILSAEEGDMNLLRGKLVLIGFCGGALNNMTDFNDIFYTPVGFDIQAIRRPDMYGIGIHANIISMLLKENYINKTPMWLAYIVVFILTFLHILLFAYFYVKHHLYYHVVAKLAQLFSFTLLLWLIFLIFRYLHWYFTAKYILLPVILSVDVLYLYEALAVFLYKKFKVKSIFVHDH